MNKKIFKIYSVVLNIISATTCVAMLLYPLFIWARNMSYVNFLDTCLLSGLGVLMYVVVSIVLHFPKIWKIPYGEKDRMKNSFYGDIYAMMIVLRAEAMLLFGYLVNSTLYDGSGVFSLIFIILIAYTLYHYFRKMKQHAKY